MQQRALITLIGLFIVFSSCRTAQKAQFNAILKSAEAQQKREVERIEYLVNKKENKLTEGNIDDSISYYIDVRLRKYQQRVDSINQTIETLKTKLENAKTFRKEFKIIQARILLLDSYNKNAQQREFVFYMIDDGLDKAKRTLFEMAAFFGPGGYTIPEEKYGIARQYFSPVIDSLIKFSNKYSGISRIATIILNGYADGTNIGEGSNLYNFLLARLNKSTATKEELNEALSEVRAENLAIFLNKLAVERETEFNNNRTLTIENIKRGMGELFPDPRITDYKVDDERRRIVLCFWSVLPNE
jgi:DNA primase large subunit